MDHSYTLSLSLSASLGLHQPSCKFISARCLFSSIALIDEGKLSVCSEEPHKFGLEREKKKKKKMNVHKHELRLSVFLRYSPAHHC